MSGKDARHPRRAGVPIWAKALAVVLLLFLVVVVIGPRPAMDPLIIDRSVVGMLLVGIFASTYPRRRK